MLFSSLQIVALGITDPCLPMKNHVFKENNSSLLAMTLDVPRCINIKDWDFYKNQTPPIFHISKETMRAHYSGWIIQKKSKWSNLVNSHILRFQQVRTCMICRNSQIDLFKMRNLRLALILFR